MVIQVVTKDMSTFSLGVLRERARLAIEDPEGEADTVAHLDYEQAWLNLIAADAELELRAKPKPDMTGDLAGRLGIARASGRMLCPAHEDRHPSLCYWHRPDGYLMVKCQAGCSYWEIRGALGL